MNFRRIAVLVLLITSSIAAQRSISVPDAQQVVGAPRGISLSGAALQKRTQEVAAEIRCPVCQGLSIADSPSEMAVNMKKQVVELLARGFTQEQIETYFEKSYGQFVLLRPKFRGVNSLVWILPLAALLAGVVIVVLTLRRLDGARAASAPTGAEDVYLARVRAMVSEEKS